MVSEPNVQPASASAWEARQVFAMAVVCLLVGLAIGYLFRGSQPAAPPPPAVRQPQQAAVPGAMGGSMPSLQSMKHMADKKAEPLLEELKADPANFDRLVQVGNIYQAAHQFQEAIGYYEKALKANPKNVPIRTEMASCMYYAGDVDGAIGQLQKALQYQPKDANSLFNLGMIRIQGKKDTKGALAAWRELLKSNPQLSPERKAQVQQLIADTEKQTKS